MSNINESESIDFSQTANTGISIVDKCMKNVFNANKILSISEKDLCRSTGYIECKDLNLKVNNLISFYESMSSESKDPLKNAIIPIKRKSTVLEGISVLETNKFSKIEKGELQTSNPISKKIKKNSEEIDCLETEYSNEDSTVNDYDIDCHSCPEDFQVIYLEQTNNNYSLPDHDNLNHSYVEHIALENDLFYKKHIQKNPSNSVSSKPTRWEINNKKKIEEDHPFADREKLYVMHDAKVRVSDYHVKLNLSTSEEDAEKGLTEGEFKVLGTLSQHSKIDQQPVDFENDEELNKIAYTNFRYPPLDLAEDLLRCTKCDQTPHYYQVVRRLFDCARLGDFTSLEEKQKLFNAARAKRKAEELEKAKKRPRRAASKPDPASVSKPSPSPSKTYSFKRKASNKFEKNVKRKNLSEEIQIKPSVEIIVPLEKITSKVDENVPVVDDIEPVLLDNESNADVKRDVELKKINTNLFDDKRDELISRGLLPAWLGSNPLHEDSEVGKFVKTELTSMGLLPGETNCASLEKVKGDKVKKFKCNKCEATFTSSNGKKYHINKVHTTEKDSIDKPYKCLEEGCFKKFTSKNGLKCHKKIKHPAKNTFK